jgi:formate dehydrogenase maturation protein FdhE
MPLISDSDAMIAVVTGRAAFAAGVEAGAKNAAEALVARELGNEDWWTLLDRLLEEYEDHIHAGIADMYDQLNAPIHEA